MGKSRFSSTPPKKDATFFSSRAKKSKTKSKNENKEIKNKGLLQSDPQVSRTLMQEGLF